MSRDHFDQYVEYTRLHFEEGLYRSGFVDVPGSDSAWVGPIEHTAGSTRVRIALTDGFPFTPPKVKPVEGQEVAWSWHRESTGELCLIADDDHQDLWWIEARTFLNHVSDWFRAANSGWSGDRPDLDLERYFEPSANIEQLFLYGDLEPYLEKLVRFSPAPNNVMSLNGVRSKPSGGAHQHRRDAYGYVTDLGALESPPRSWADIARLITPTLNIDSRIRKRELDLVVAIYDRGGHQGVIVLSVRAKGGHGIEARILRSAPDTELSRICRAGANASALNAKRVAIVGVGAVGSFVADQLYRCHIGAMTLIDGETVLPGNTVRHLVDRSGIGLPKPIAVKRHITSRAAGKTCEIETRTAHLTGVSEVFQLLEEHDLVINATADFAVTAMLHQAALSARKRILSVALQNDGDTLRVDVLPPLDGQSALSASANPGGVPSAPYFEVGCGSPISPTPPHAVQEAAAVAVRHAVGLLVARPLHPSGEVRHLNHGAW